MLTLRQCFKWKFCLCALVLAFAVSFVTPQRLFADELSHRKLAEEFIVLTETAKMMSNVLNQIKADELARLDTVDYAGKNPEKDGKLKKRVGEYLDERLTWNNFREGYLDVYVAAFTEEELKAALDFYKSPVGKKLLDGAQDLRMKLLQSTQIRLQGMTMDLKRMEKEFVSEQKKQRK